MRTNEPKHVRDDADSECNLYHVVVNRVRVDFTSNKLTHKQNKQTYIQTDIHSTDAADH